MAQGDEGDGGTGGNRSVLSNGVRYLGQIVTVLGEILGSLNALAPTTIGVSTVAALPTAAAAGQGARRLVTDANSTVFHNVVAGGGTNVVPCYSDGSAWRIG